VEQVGVLVIQPPGLLVWEHHRKVAGDNASPAEVLSALGAAARSPARSATTWRWPG
jgi:hypothetical protein